MLILEMVFLHRGGFKRKKGETSSIRYGLEHQIGRKEADWMKSKSEQLRIRLLICKILKS